jgi:hypothetical protein
LLLATTYMGWILMCSHFDGVFPYPFLNKMPWPQVPGPPLINLLIQRASEAYLDVAPTLFHFNSNVNFNFIFKLKMQAHVSGDFLLSVG